MASNKVGSQTLVFSSRPRLQNWATVTGPREGQGPLGSAFDMVNEDPLLAQISWEKAEQKLMQYSIELALSKQSWQTTDMDFFLAGDLLNQIVSSNFTARELGIPFLGVYGACSTLAEGFATAGILLDGGYADKVGIAAVSHHNSAEKQLRFPTEMGTQRPMAAQWTVTGGGSYLIEKGDAAPSVTSSWVITHATIGKVNDLGIDNVNDMGSAMAPAAYDTIKAHFSDTGRGPEDFDYIITGDLGQVGFDVLVEFLQEDGMTTEQFRDCGILIYDSSQDAHSGGSGCGCSAVVLGPVFLDKKGSNYLDRTPQVKKSLQRILFIGTGALLSPITSFQGETIPGIAHAICFERGLEA